ncbi:MAG TPA: hypothetical protein VMF61_02505 [Candidatus Acidoferrales bacterium]|nr:hypothetical protein [Candidatus Acidoferrales bacterium]
MKGKILTIMHLRRLFLTAGFLGAIAATAAAAFAQEATPDPAEPTPAPAQTPTFMDRQYDGKFHISAAPYIWAPTIKTNIQYTIPVTRKVNKVEGSITVPPVDYVSNINSAGMISFNARQGSVMAFGDFIYVNANASASASSAIVGPLGHLDIPVSISTNTHLSTSVWELGVGTALAHGHDADLNLFVAYRSFPINVNLDYSSMVGMRSVRAPAGSLTDHVDTTDFVFGLQGKAYLGDGHWMIPYYGDIGSGANNQTWEGYGGVGYTFNHGQSLVALYRGLHYYGFPSYSLVQKFDMEGPLIGYSFQL